MTNANNAPEVNLLVMITLRGCHGPVKIRGGIPNFVIPAYRNGSCGQWAASFRAGTSPE